MINNKQIGAIDLLAGLEIMALLIVRTLPAQAIAAITADQVPYRRQRLQSQVASAAVARLFRPAADLGQLQDPIILGQEHARSLLGHAQAAQADIVGSPLDEHGSKRVRHYRLKKRNVFANQLFLEANGVGRYDDAT